jgi:hypothetical protein
MPALCPSCVLPDWGRVGAESGRTFHGGFRAACCNCDTLTSGARQPDPLQSLVIGPGNQRSRREMPVAVGGWQAHAEFLGPLIAALGDVAPDHA